MSQNIEQIYIANPTASMVSTDLLYLGRSPYNTSDDFAITFANFVLSIGTATKTASTISRWDANVNMSANNFIEGFATTATAAGTTVLTVASPYYQYFTGSTTQTVTMPVTSTLAQGQSWWFVNNSSGAVTVQSSGANSIQVMAANSSMLITCQLTSGTTAASWNASYFADTGGVSSITGTANQVIASAATGDVTLSLPQSIATTSVPTFANVIEALSSTATAASTTTLTSSSNHNQEFTGSTTQTVEMPVTSTLTAGQSYYIINNSSGAVTINSSGGNAIQILAANTSALITCVSTSGTTAASWQSSYFADSAGVLSITGTADQVIASSPTGDITLSLPQSINTTSSPTFAALTLTNPHVVGAGGLVSFQILTTGTGATYTKPAGITSILVEAVGGGGGGGGIPDATGGGAAAGGGGGGAYSRLWVAAAAASYTYTVGASGAAGAAGNNNGSAATASTFVGTGANISAGGGGGGNGSANSTSPAIQGSGGSAGSASGGDINIAGGAGETGYTNNAAGVGITVGGNGGVLIFCQGANRSLAGATGNAGATNTGAGGSGACVTNNATTFAGGAGAAGIIIVWEFC